MIAIKVNSETFSIYATSVGFDESALSSLLNREPFSIIHCSQQEQEVTRSALEQEESVRSMQQFVPPRKTPAHD